MDKNLKCINEKKIERTIKALKDNNINGYLVNSKEELIVKVSELINDNDLVACGGSMTLFETGVIDFVRNGKYKFLDRYKEGINQDEVKEIFRKSFFADVYLTSTNAITEDGELYNVDGNGNRVAAMLYGPDKVIVVTGVNKIVKDIDEAINRVKSTAAPANTQRLNTETPCKFTGTCMDCSSKDRICCEYTVIKRQRDKERMYVIFINENFGY